jgi:hypothetical protein
MIMLSSLSKKSVVRGFVALSLVAAFSGMAVNDAEARHRGRHHAGHSRNNNTGAILGLGLLGALAIGAIASSNQNQGYYEEPRYAPQGAYGYQQQYYVQRPQPRAQYIVETRYDDYGNPYQVRRRCVERYPNNPSGSCH